MISELSICGESETLTAEILKPGGVTELLWTWRQSTLLDLIVSIISALIFVHHLVLVKETVIEVFGRLSSSLHS